MIDKSFQGFVIQNLGPLDELARRYAEYRIQVTQSYLEELRIRIRTHTPQGYRFEGSSSVVAESEQVCGWVKNLEIAGIRTAVALGFAFYTTSASLAGGWPLMNGSCWTGAKIWLPAKIRDAALAHARELSLDTEPVDSNWLLWRRWAPLSATTVEGFHQRVVGEDRALGQTEIIDQLVQWKVDFEKVFAHLQENQDFLSA